MAKPLKDRYLFPVQTKLKDGQKRAFNRAKRKAGLTEAEFLRGLIEKHLREVGK